MSSILFSLYIACFIAILLNLKQEHRRRQNVQKNKITEKEIVARIDEIAALESDGLLNIGLIEERFNLKRNLEEVI